MSPTEAVDLLKSKGYDAEYDNKIVKVYYNPGEPSIFEEVGKILRNAGYVNSYGTCGRYSKEDKKED